MVRIKKIEEQALDEIEELWGELQEYHRAVNPAISSVPFAKRKKMLTSKRFAVYAASIKKKLVGFCIPSIDNNDIGIIESIFVQSAHRNRSIGGTLLKKSLGWIRKQNIKIIHIGVIYGNDRVFSFYEKFGFKPKAYILSN